MNSILAFLIVTGPGVATFPKSGNVYPCEEVFLRYEITQDKFKVSDGGYRCGILNASYDYFTLTIRDGKLFEKNEEVGTISKDEINLSKYDSADDSHFHLRLKFNGKNIDYTETWKENGDDALIVKGTLTEKL